MKPTTVKFHTFINVCKGRLYGEVLYLHNCGNRTLKTPELKDYAFHYDCINIHYKSVDRDGDKVQLALLTVVYKYEQVLYREQASSALLFHYRFCLER